MRKGQKLLWLLKLYRDRNRSAVISINNIPYFVYEGAHSCNSTGVSNMTVELREQTIELMRCFDSSNKVRYSSEVKLLLFDCFYVIIWV